MSAANDACALCDIAHGNYRSAVQQWEKALDTAAAREKIAMAEQHMNECLDSCVRYEEEHDRGGHAAEVLDRASAQDDARLSSAHVTALFRVLREASPNAVFMALALWYDSLHAVLEPGKRSEQAAKCAVARDGCEAIVSALSELAVSNDAECAELIAKLRASLAARRVA